MIASVNGTAIVVALVAVLVFVVVTLAAVLTTAVKRKRALLLLPLLLLLPVTASYALDYRLRLMAGFTIAGLVTWIVIPRRRRGDDGESSAGVGIAFLSLLAVVGAITLVWSLLNGMGKPATVYFDDYTYSVALTDTDPVAIREVRVVAHSLPHDASVSLDRPSIADDRVRAEVAQLDDDPAVCPACSARFRVVLALGDPQPDERLPVSYDLSLRAEGTQLNVKSLEAVTIDVKVVELATDRRRLTTTAKLETDLTEDRPVSIVRGEIRLPSAAMTAPRLDEYPAVLSTHTDLDNAQASPNLFRRFSHDRWDDCVARKECVLSETVLIRADELDTGNGTSARLSLTTNVDYLVPPFPGDAAAPTVTLETPSAWVHQRVTGSVPSNDASSGIGFEVSITGITEERVVDVAAVATISNPGRKPATWTALDRCRQPRCIIDVRQGTLDPSAMWVLDLYWGFFDVAEPPVGFRTTVSEPRLYPVASDG